MSVAGSGWTAESLRELRERGRAFYEMFPGAKARELRDGPAEADTADRIIGFTRGQPRVTSGSSHAAMRPCRPVGAVARVARILGAFAEASLAALGFILAILLVGMPIAFAVRVLHDLGIWIIEMWQGGTLGAELASLASVVGIIGVIVLFISVLVVAVRLFGAPQSASGELSERCVTRIASFREC